MTACRYTACIERIVTTMLSVVQELQKKLSRCLHDGERAGILNKLSEQHRLTGDHTMCRLRAEQALELADKT